MDRLILDTTVLVTVERSARALDQVIGDEDDVVIAAITAAELLVGVELAAGKTKQRRHAFVEDVFSAIPIEPYDLDVARTHASLLAHTRRAGRTRGAHDLLIAATALTHNRTVVSADASGFEDLPGLDLRPLV
ncbi:MAG: PIN domain-containing protein [Thermoleophilia bacterium]|nr:PIN domain-containing protein [Thermoleophilia bacterium]